MWRSVASAERAQGAEIQLPRVLVETLRDNEDCIVEVVLLDSNPHLKVFFRLGGQGERTE